MNIVYHIAHAALFLLSLLPLRLLYVLSDGLYYIVYYIARYRRPLVRQNLKSSFPEKTEDEIIDIERGFYSWFCDYFVETIKLSSISKAAMGRRMRFEGTERVKASLAKKQSCAVYLGHYCNWEWVTSLPLAIGDAAQCCQIYHVLENPAFDKLFLQLRSRMGAESISMAETLRQIARYRQENRQIVIGFIADQAPFWNNIHHWVDFLNHDTPVFTGTERIARKANFAVYYLDIRRERRGYYVAEFKLISERPAELPEFAATEKYFQELEATIRRQPQFWLWTHNRWKRTRKEWERIIDPVTKKMRSC